MPADFTPEQATRQRDMMCEHIEAEQKTFLNVVAAMPDAKLRFKPEERIMDYATLARHVGGSGQFFLKFIVEGQADMGGEDTRPLPTKTSALVEELRKTFATTMKGFRELTPQQLTRKIDFFGMGAYQGLHYLNWDMVHLIHHRGQMTVYLRVAGAKVPSVYGPSLDVTFEDMMKEKQ